MSEHLSTSGARRRLPRTRGATSGLLLLALGAWGALIPFIGPWFNFAYSPDSSWTWTAGRGWLEVLPGVVTFVGGLLLLMSASRLTTSLGAWLGIGGGAWFIVGPQLAALLHLGSIGAPTGSSVGLRALESLAFFSALGAAILFLAATAFGRLSVVTVGDLRGAERREAARVKAEEAAARDAVARDALARDTAARDAAARDAAARDAAARDTAARDAAARDAAARDTAARDGATAAPTAPAPGRYPDERGWNSPAAGNDGPQHETPSQPTR